MTTRQAINKILSDGKPRSVNELHLECKPLTFRSVEGVARKMIRSGELCPVAGFACRPANGPTCRRYTLVEEAV